MMLVTELSMGHPTVIPWRFSQATFYMIVAHLIVYRLRWRNLRPGHRGPHYASIGSAYLNNHYVNDVVFAASFAGIAYALGEFGFAQWWALNIPMSLVSNGLIEERYRSIARTIVSDQSEMDTVRYYMGEHDDV